MFEINIHSNTLSHTHTCLYNDIKTDKLTHTKNKINESQVHSKSKDDIKNNKIRYSSDSA